MGQKLIHIGKKKKSSPLVLQYFEHYFISFVLSHIYHRVNHVDLTILPDKQFCYKSLSCADWR